MKLLAFDTATEACSVALCWDNQVQQVFQLAPRQHAELVLPMVQQLLAAAGVQLADLDAIAYGAGPGSFMGVRIATTLAQGLAFSADLPVLAVSTLQALAQTAHDQHQVTATLVAWDARMQEMYWGAYCLREGLMQPVVADQLTKPADLQVPEQSEPWSLCGNAWSVYHQDLPEPVAQFKPHYLDLYPTAAAVAKIGAKALESGKAFSPLDARPCYLRNQVT